MIDFDGSTFVAGKRDEFSPEVHHEFGSGDGKAICHMISYALMRDMIITAMNLLPGQSRDAKNIINTLINSVVIADSDLGDEDYADNVRGDCQVALKKLIAAKTNDDRLSYGNQLLNVLNNFKYNLRVGDADWNIFIGDSIDPNSWIYLSNITPDGKECDGDTMFLYSSNDVLDDEPFEYEGEHCGEGFYLIDPLDCERLYKLLHPRNDLPVEFKISIGVYEDSNCNRYLASSNNRFSRFGDENNEQELTDVPVYYFYDGLFYRFY